MDEHAPLVQLVGHLLQECLAARVHALLLPRLALRPHVLGRLLLCRMTGTAQVGWLVSTLHAEVHLRQTGRWLHRPDVLFSQLRCLLQHASAQRMALLLEAAHGRTSGGQMCRLHLATLSCLGEVPNRRAASARPPPPALSAVPAAADVLRPKLPAWERPDSCQQRRA